MLHDHNLPRVNVPRVHLRKFEIRSYLDALTYGNFRKDRKFEIRSYSVIVNLKLGRT